jgi:hypothetical protein
VFSGEQRKTSTLEGGISSLTLKKGEIPGVELETAARNGVATRSQLRGDR